MRGCFTTVSVYAVGLLISPPDSHFRIVSQHEAVCAWLDRLPVDLHVAADQAVDYPIGEIAHAGAFEHDAVLDLGILDFDVVHDRGERADVGVHDARVTSDDSRTANHRPLHDRAFFEHD